MNRPAPKVTENPQEAATKLNQERTTQRPPPSPTRLTSPPKKNIIETPAFLTSI